MIKTCVLNMIMMRIRR